MQNDKYAREYRQRLRRQVIELYGGACACCGEDTYEFLTLEHKNGGGREHSRSFGNNYYSMWRWLRDNPVSDEFEILCYNCNCAKGHHGVCPHAR